jgi:hypothetical protein
VKYKSHRFGGGSFKGTFAVRAGLMHSLSFDASIPKGGSLANAFSKERAPIVALFYISSIA